MRISSTRKMSPAMKFFMARIFPWPFFITGGLVLFFGVRGMIRAKASLAWPTTDGTIVSSSVETHHSSGRNGGDTTYHAEVLYEFTLDGVTYNGNRVAYGDYGTSNSSHARGIVNQYPEGAEVTVHYMPDNPEVCLLEPGMRAQAWFLPGLGFVFFCAGGLMIVFLPKAMAKMNAQEQRSVSGDE